jgi:hypothetical protein
MNLQATCNLATVVINVQDMNRAVDFWPAAAGYVRRERDWDPEFMMLVDPSRRETLAAMLARRSGRMCVTARRRRYPADAAGYRRLSVEEPQRAYLLSASTRRSTSSSTLPVLDKWR